ncbi:hypothetical protein J2X65_002009 [Ancylobacter sp. 3268]|uniref:hypothetical protein n=1 Tax=Ancylobacter sp. 3268 TaxID=2817752 RepID=UPI0028602B1F|nr:hypothetical protein [Ancylobacter sp. 3268]MDR6952650.1 hypothetical protein [Ancylobacter sp. 3268]
MADERPAVDGQSIARAIKVAQLGTTNRRFLTNMSIDDMTNMSRVVLALNLVATEAADYLAAGDRLDNAPDFAAEKAADAEFQQHETSLAGLLLTLGFITEKEDANGQEG